MKTYKFFQLSENAQLTAMKTYAIDFYDCDLKNLNDLEIKHWGGLSNEAKRIE